MWVAIVGSCRASAPEGWSIHFPDEFAKACFALGESLAENGHKLVIAHANEPVADKFAKDGFESKCRSLGRPIDIRVAETPSKVWAQAHLHAVTEADAVIAVGGADGTYTAAQAAILAGKRLIPVPCFGGAARSILLAEYSSTRVVTDRMRRLNLIKPDGNDQWIHELCEVVIEVLRDFPRILVIHGHSRDRLALCEVLRAIEPKIPPPVVMQATKPSGYSIPDEFDRYARAADAAIALITPDDCGIAVVDDQGADIPARSARTLHLRARQNVWVEVGWFWGRLGIDRMMLLTKGKDIEIPSDLRSINSQDYFESPAERSFDIRHFVNLLRDRPVA